MNSTFTASAAHAAMACPKCAGEMRAYERSGVIVDQCRDCRGIFLDRGELEHLVDLETSLVDRREPRVPRDDGRAQAAFESPTQPATARGDRRDGYESPMEPFGGAGELGGLGDLGDLGDLFGRRDRAQRTPDERTGSAIPPKKRGGFFKDLLEGFGE